MRENRSVFVDRRQKQETDTKKILEKLDTTIRIKKEREDTLAQLGMSLYTKCE